MTWMGYEGLFLNLSGLFSELRGREFGHLIDITLIF